MINRDSTITPRDWEKNKSYKSHHLKIDDDILDCPNCKKDKDGYTEGVLVPIDCKFTKGVEVEILLSCTKCGVLDKTLILNTESNDNDPYITYLSWLEL